MEMIGQRFGKLVVVSQAGANQHQKMTWVCRCDCGGESTPTTGGLRSGRTKSCGCEKRKGNRLTHGKRHTSTYTVWCNMRARCDNPQHPAYQNYGGRGVSYDPRWSSFQEFLADMGERPSGLTLDRIDNNGNYEKSNCRWTDRKTQMRNTRVNHWVEIGGEKKCLKDWCAEFGTNMAAVYRRLELGWSMEEALSAPSRYAKGH